VPGFSDGKTATSVEISGTSFPARTTFTEVGVKKKSFCGSLDSDKPCLHVDFGRVRDANIPLIEALIGSRYITLNNSKQDRSTSGSRLGTSCCRWPSYPIHAAISPECSSMEL